MPKIIKIISWNVNGVRAAYKKGLIDWLTSTSPDILCLQETKTAVDQLPKDLIEPKGYHSVLERLAAKRPQRSGRIYEDEALTSGLKSRQSKIRRKRAPRSP